MKNINTEQMKSMKADNQEFLLVNTLDKEHFQETQIPGAVNIPQSQDNFAKQVEQAAGDSSKPIVVYCASQECQSSAQAAEKLEQAGFTAVFDYEGGAKAWKEAGESLVTA